MPYSSDSIAKLYPADVFRLAIYKSGMSPEQVANKMHTSKSVLIRATTEDDYAPSFHSLPAFCKAVGNTIPIDWLYARATQSLVITVSPITTMGLQVSLLNIGKEIGDIFRVAKESLKDDQLTKNELRALLKETLDARNGLDELARDIRAREMQVSRR